MSQRDQEADDATNREIRETWRGRFYEDYSVGDIYKHPFARTVTETDNVWFTNLTMCPNPMHFNEPYASETQFGERLVNGAVVLMIAMGMSCMDISVNATANLGYDEIRHHAPTFHGDTIFSESEIIHKREMESDEKFGIVTVETRAYNQRDELVLTFERTANELKREYADPQPETPIGWIEGIGTQPEDLE